MRKSIKRCLTVALSVLVCSLSCVPAAAEVKNFVIDTDNNMLPIPETYMLSRILMEQILHLRMLKICS